MTSHIYILYLVATKPYQTPVFNAYMLANETFYSSLIILIFIFSDATPQLNIKVIAGIALVISIYLLVLANLVFIGYVVWQGRDKLKLAIKTAKATRLEEEKKEKEEEELRKSNKEKEEAEFNKLPDDTGINVSQPDMTINTTLGNLNQKKAQAIAKGKGKGKDDDNVAEGPYTTAKKGGKDSGEPQTDEKFFKKTTAGENGPAAKKSKVSADEKASSGDSDPNKQKGPIIPNK